MIAIVEFSHFFNLHNSTGFGGALFFDYSTAFISHCAFIECSAVLGGGIYLNNSETSVLFCSFKSDHCTNARDDPLNLGGNAICEESGKEFFVSISIFEECAPSQSTHGESAILSHAIQNKASYLNISNCFGKWGGILSFRGCLFNSQISYINSYKSKDFSMIECINSNGYILCSNFLYNEMTNLFLHGNLLCEECVFIGNTDVGIHSNEHVEFKNCEGKYPGNPNSNEDIQTIQFPQFRIRISRRFLPRKSDIVLLFSLSLFQKIMG